MPQPGREPVPGIILHRAQLGGRAQRLGDPFGGALPPDSPIRALTNVITTPHIAGPTVDARWMMGDLIVEDLRRFFVGEKPLYAITEERVEHVA